MEQQGCGNVLCRSQSDYFGDTHTPAKLEGSLDLQRWKSCVLASICLFRGPPVQS